MSRHSYDKAFNDECEFMNEIYPDADRCIAPPMRTAEDNAYRATALRWILAVSLMAWLAAIYLWMAS